MAKLNFSAKRHGYHFSNLFTNRILPGVVNGVQTKGLCGGMTMSVLDYWRSGVPIPAHSASDLPADPASNGNNLPLESSRLRTYIFDRQMNSLFTSLMVTRWVVAPWFGPNDFHNWAIGSEFQRVRDQIARGRPAMLGLWGMNGPTSGHQVLCVGFETNPLKLYIYDPNRPDEDCELVPVSPAVGVEARLSSGGGAYETYRGYFFTDVYNWGQTPPLDPPYKDLVVSQGLTLEPSGHTDVGGTLKMSVTVRNAGEYPSRFKYLFVWVRGPNGENLDTLLGGAEPGLTALQPGQEHLITRQCAAFGAQPGTYTVGVSYLSSLDEWLNLPPGNAGAHAQNTITLFRKKALAIDQVINVPEASGAVNTGIVCQPGDEVELTGTGTIWAGIWLTGVNGPEGWLNRIETNPASPYINKPDAHPYSLVGRFGNDPFFYVGTSLSRRAFASSSAQPLILRTNDNQPGNGSGAFQCLVRVWR